MTNIKIILGSNRPGRFAHQPGEWLLEQSRQIKDATFEIIDLADVDLPFMDEPQPPLSGVQQNDHTKAWSKIIGDADGFVLIAPEYNHSFTPVLKNALDYLYYEWNHKPVAFLSYGADAGGARAVEHLRGVAGNLGMYGLKEVVILSQYYLRMDEKQHYQFSDAEAAQAQKMLTQIAFWAEQMKQSREKLAA